MLNDAGEYHIDILILEEKTVTLDHESMVLELLVAKRVNMLAMYSDLSDVHVGIGGILVQYFPYASVLLYDIHLEVFVS